MDEKMKAVAVTKVINSGEKKESESFLRKGRRSLIPTFFTFKDLVKMDLKTTYALWHRGASGGIPPLKTVVREDWSSRKERLYFNAIQRVCKIIDVEAKKRTTFYTAPTAEQVTIMFNVGRAGLPQKGLSNGRDSALRTVDDRVRKARRMAKQVLDNQQPRIVSL